MDKIVVLITAPSEDVAAKIARTIVEERLAACANIVKNVRSIYRWEGVVQDDPEVLMVVKTAASLFEALEKRVRELHPYTVPEIITMPIVSGSKPYMDWIAESTG